MTTWGQWSFFFGHVRQLDLLSLATVTLRRPRADQHLY
jgi:hypothetical protein